MSLKRELNKARRFVGRGYRFVRGSALRAEPTQRPSSDVEIVRLAEGEAPAYPRGTMEERR